MVTVTVTHYYHGYGHDHGGGADQVIAAAENADSKADWRASGGMMSDEMALKTAIDLMHVPSQVRLLRSEPLPNDVQMLLRIAAGEEEAASAAVALTGRSHQRRAPGRHFLHRTDFVCS